MSLAYVLPIALLGLATTTVRQRSRWLMIVALVALPVFYTGHYLLLQAIQGWPVDSAPPDEFRLLGFDVREPDSTSSGEILIWIRSEGQASPRVHRLPYTRELHQAISKAGQRLAQGSPQRGTRLDPGDSNGMAGSRAHGGTLSFHDEQPRQLPSKEGDRP